MACRVGITTDSDTRKRAWEAEYPQMENWTVLGPFDSKEAAQKKETELAEDRGCEAHPGGREPDDPSAKWYVYSFDF